MGNIGEVVKRDDISLIVLICFLLRNVLGLRYASPPCGFGLVAYA